MEAALVPLLDRLAAKPPFGPVVCEGWRVEPLAHTLSGSTYRAVSGQVDLGVKFFTRDRSDHAGREFACLTTLSRAGLEAAPEPVMFEPERYECPVVVRTWLGGEIIESIPENDRDWRAILEHLLTVHAVTSETVANEPRSRLLDAAFTLRSADEGVRRLREHLARELPDPGDRPTELISLLADIERADHPWWPPPRLRLCRGDCNRYNFLLRGTSGNRRCVSFDWEYGGWGDPACEVADLICAPTFALMPPERREWIIADYADRAGDEISAIRTRTYCGLINAWWAIRWARFSNEIVAHEPLDEERRERISVAYERRVSLARASLERSPPS